MAKDTSGNPAIVVIGRNEGPRLERCLASLLPWMDAVVYVDSGSTDGSPDTAQCLGARVVRLDTGPFTAARGRQAGLEALGASSPGSELVQYVDGDCVLDPGWLANGAAYLRAHPRLAGVCGRLREEHAPERFFSRMAQADWDRPPGRAEHLGGIAMYRIAALRGVGGWGVSMIAGEEPELCCRLLDAGWELHRLPEAMATHDIAMHTFRQFWRRSVRTGHACAEIAWLRGRGSGRRYVVRCVRFVFYGLVLPLAVATLVPLSRWAAILCLLVWAQHVARLAWQRRRAGDPWRQATAHAILVAVANTAMAAGMFTYGLHRVMGRRRNLIEYKPGLPPKSGTGVAV